MKKPKQKPIKIEPNTIIIYTSRLGEELVNKAIRKEYEKHIIKKK